MNRYSLTILFSIFSLLLSACSASSERGVFKPASAQAEQSVVYIYRPTAVSNALYSPDLYLNDEYKLTVKNGKKSRLNLIPGNYVFELEPGGDYKGLTKITMALAAGRTYYIRVDTTLKINSSSNYEPYNRTFNLIKVDEMLAQQQITECCLSNDSDKEPRTQNKDSKDEDESSFSVDKTQNPFSH